MLFFSRQSADNTDCLSLPPGSAGKGGKSTEALALLREEAAKQRAGDEREGNTLALFFSLHLSLFMLFRHVQERQAASYSNSFALLPTITVASLLLPNINFFQPAALSLFVTLHFASRKHITSF